MTVLRTVRAVSTGIGVLLAASACELRVPEVSEVSASETAGTEAAGRAPTHVDSIFPIEESLLRFRAQSGPEPMGLSGGAPSLDALIAGFGLSLATRDTAALLDLLMTRDEFGWLYYPHTRYTQRPYELAPDVLWLQIENGASRGLGRLLDRLAGKSLGSPTYSCGTVPAVEGPNRIWEGCTVRIDPAEEDGPEMRLFGSILERDGIFKFVSYTNDF